MNRRLSWRCLAAIGVLVFAATAAAQQPPAGVNGEEWARIQEQIEVERHTITESDRPGMLYRADNSTQRFSAHFGAEDVLITPRGHGEPAWHLGLRLTAWGAAHDLKQVDFATATAERNRVEYRRGPLTEWYVNTTMGLEQGFTIEAPPGEGIDELVLEMTIEGDLTPEFVGGGLAISFHRENSNATLSYSGIKAWDAVGEILEARIEIAGTGKKLRLVTAVSDTAWPITVDPTLSLIQKIPSPLDPDPQSGQFGLSADLDGDWMVVGRLGEANFFKVGAHLFRRDDTDPTAWDHIVEIEPDEGGAGEDHVAVAISGDLVIIGVPASPPSGKAFVFERNHGGPDAWGQAATLDPIDGGASQFGFSVALSGDIALVGAPSTDQSDGAAYVYGRNHGGANNWGQVTRISDPNPGEYDHLGYSVALSGETAVIGSEHAPALVCYRNQGGIDSWGQVAAVSQSGDSVSVSGDIAVVGRPDFEAVEIFERNVGGLDAWGHVTTVVPNDPGGGNQFGANVAIENTTVVVGAWRDSTAAVQAGSAYIFERDHGGADAWGQVTKKTASNASQGENFGWAVALSEDTAVIGTPCSYQFGEYESSGSVYIFERDQGGSGAWGEAANIPSPPFLSAWFNKFGTSVDMDGGIAVIGSPRKRGWVHIYQNAPDEPGDWERLTRITADDDESPWSDYFGFSTAINGDTVVVGAYGDNYYGSSNTIWDLGSAYVFQRDQGGPDNWGVVTRIFAHTGEYFGYSVAIDGDAVVVGGDGDLYYGFPPAHVFQRDFGGPNAWGHVAELVPSDAHAYAPYRKVAVSGNTAIVGWFDNGLLYVFERNQGGPDAWGESARIDVGRWGGGIAISGDTLIAGYRSISDPAAHVYQRDQGGPGNWGLVATITPPNGIVDQHFGTSVSIDGNVAAVVSLDWATYNEPGAVYFFHRNPGGAGAWEMLSRFSDSNNYSKFGISTSVSAEVAIVGAPEDSNESGIEAGAAYILTIGARFFCDGFESGDTSLWSRTEP